MEAYYKKNRLKLIEYQKKYNLSNNTKIIEYNRNYYIANKISIKLKQKTYYEKTHKTNTKYIKQEHNVVRMITIKNPSGILKF